MTGMDGKKNGRRFSIFGRSKTPSPQHSPVIITLSDDSEGDKSIVPPQSPTTKPKPSPLPKKWGWNWKEDGCKRTKPRKSVRHGTTFKFKIPENIPQHSPRDEEEDPEDEEEEEEEEEEEQLNPAVSDGEDHTHSEGPHDEDEDDPKQDESMPMEVEHTMEATHQEQVSRSRSRTPRPPTGKARDPYEEHLRVTMDYPSEKEMMREVMRRSHCDAYAPPPMMGPPLYYSPPPPPAYSPYPPYGPCPPYSSYSPYYPYPSTFDAPRNSYAGSSSHGPIYDPPRYSSDSFRDSENVAALKERVDYVQRERDYYKRLYEESEKKKGKGKRG